MANEVYIGTDAEKFKEVLDAHTDKDVEADRMNRIIQDYSGKYNVEGEVVTVQGRQVHIDYLPTIDAMLEAVGEYEHPKEVVGAALFRIESKHRLFLTKTDDPNLRKIYVKHMPEAEKLVSELWRLNDKEYANQFAQVTAAILSGSFEVVFGQLYGAWRRSLAEK
jgi:hypothetical protein